MALSAAAVRAIAIRRSIARRNASAIDAPVQPKRQNTSMLAACVEAAGFASHAAY